MSEWQNAENPMLEYYDGDFPSGEHARYPENFDSTTRYQGLAFDVGRYAEIAKREGGPVLEPFCGTGRVAIPLARAGLHVTGVDFSGELLAQCRKNLERVGGDAASRVRLVEQDVRALALAETGFRLAIIAFNSLLCVPDFEDQQAVLVTIARHLVPRGLLVLDVVNPLRLPVDGDATPKPFFTRRHPQTGRRYTRFAMLGAFDAEHRQRLHGWYDEMDDDGHVRRRPYETTWRPIHRFELALMLERAGFAVESIEGGHRGEPYAAESARMFVQARRT